MAEPPIACPACGTLVPVDPEWRIAQCTRCQRMILRMEDEPEFD